MAVASVAGPDLGEAEVLFSVHDPRRALRRVRLVHELWRPRIGPDFARAAGSRVWELRLPRPPVDRIEYQLELTRARNRTEVVCDPDNPSRAPGAFGEKSVVELPGYEPPAWLDHEQPARGHTAPLKIWSRALRVDLPAVVWSSPGTRAGRRLPLLVVHDGPEYADYSALLRLLEHLTTSGALPPMRAALLAPVDRNQIYSASAAYARTLADDVLPALDEVAPSPPRRRMRVGMGASLGALGMIHAHRGHADLFGALYLQSGSYFRERLDQEESDFVRFGRIARFVRALLSGKGADPIPVTMTCGTVEENLACNRAACAALAAQGYDVRLHVNRDAHNWTSWRDTFDPHLVELLQRKWA